MVCTSGHAYTVRSGDTLFLIAQRELGDGNRWQEIMKPDGTHFTAVEAKSIQAGQELCLPQGGNTFATILTRQIYESIFPQRKPLYTYAAFVAAHTRFPLFCNEGTPIQRKREAAAFLAHVAHETASLYYIEEIALSRCCDPANTTYPCAPGQIYHGRGPLQISWNYNYGAAGQFLGLDLLSNPSLASTNGVISFQTALWFWMIAQLPKPSCHAIMTETWTPTSKDKNAGRIPGFGMTINIINGGSECGRPTTPAVTARVAFYEQFAKLLGVSPGNNIYCNGMAHY
jgi:chitinase